ncbi:glycosyl Hydrolase Family 88 [bacterium BMS3Bbin04]|nr:glycosyl Hydrolase Family 88 [bacterium BMS3Bbin04]
MPSSDTSTRIDIGRNRLAKESSEYLRQHADNPVDWYPWGDEALFRARREQKPIFLSIGYSSCHWCHVMEHEVFENAEIAAYLNEHFICIKVDREERPDLDRIYMEAVQLLTRSGGWPMSVWLTPDLEPFFGGTYYPAETFFDLIQKLDHAWNENRDQIEDTASQLHGFISRNTASSHPESFKIDAINAIGEQALEQIDSLHGGFSGSTKFPLPVRWQMLLHLYRRTGDMRYSKAVRDALIAMASGGVQDHIGGGFHRYSVDASWTVPHFEKMLYDNAQLASLYTEAAAMFSEKALFGHVAQRTLDFMLAEMYDAENGGFYSSFDADSGGEEGTFYVWTPEEITSIVGERDSEALMMLFGITREGNFEDKNRTVLTRRYPYEEVSARTDRPVEELKALVEKHRKSLYEARKKRVPPRLDKKIVTSWNGLAISAMAHGYRVFGDRRYLEAAEKTAAFLRDKHWNGRKLIRSSTDGSPSGNGVLDDYSFLGNAMIDLFSATGNKRHLAWALDFANVLKQSFRHEDAGFYHTFISDEAPLGRQVEIIDNVEPSGFSMALRVFLRLAALQGSSEYLIMIKEDIEAYAEIIKKVGLEMAGMVDVALLLRGPMYELVVVRPPDPEGKLPKRSSLRKHVDEMLPPYVQMIPLEDDLPTDDLLTLLPTISDKAAISNSVTAYLCRFGTCNAPTSEIQELHDQLLEDWKI